MKMKQTTYITNVSILVMTILLVCVDASALRASNSNFTLDIQYGNLYGYANNLNYTIRVFAETLQTKESKSGNESIRMGFLKKDVDLTAPNVTILSPTSGANVAGLNVEFSYNASDNRAVKRIIYQIDGGSNLTDADSDGSFVQYLNFDPHNLTVWALDERNNTASATVSFSNYAVTSGVTGGGSSGGGGGGGAMPDETEPACNLQLVRPTGKIAPIGPPGTLSPEYEIVVKNTASARDTFHFSVIGNASCELKYQNVEVYGNSTGTNTIQCLYDDHRITGKLVIENAVCDTSVPIVVDTSVVGAVVDTALKNPIFVIAVSVGMIFLVFGLWTLMKFMSS